MLQIAVASCFAQPCCGVSYLGCSHLTLFSLGLSCIILPWFVLSRFDLFLSYLLGSGHKRHLIEHRLHAKGSWRNGPDETTPQRKSNLSLSVSCRVCILMPCCEVFWFLLNCHLQATSPPPRPYQFSDSNHLHRALPQRLDHDPPPALKCI